VIGRSSNDSTMTGMRTPGGRTCNDKDSSWSQWKDITHGCNALFKTRAAVLTTLAPETAGVALTSFLA